MNLETGVILPGSLELRQEGDGLELSGRFPYGERATVSDRGRVRKEEFQPRAFQFAIERDTARSIDLLVGHDFNRPLANRAAGSLDIRDSAEAVTFTARLPRADADQPSWVRDAVLSIRSGLMVGLSPGFRVPPRSAVPNAEGVVPEGPQNPGVFVRSIRAAVLREFSIVSNPQYPGASVELRSEDLWTPETPANEDVLRWL